MKKFVECLNLGLEKILLWIFKLNVRSKNWNPVRWYELWYQGVDSHECSV